MISGDGMTGAHECGADAAAYVLGALEPAEVEAFRAHMDTCAICRDEVEAFGVVAQALPMAAPQQPLPKGLKRRVMQEVEREAKLARGRQPRMGWRLPAVRWTPRTALAGFAVLAVVIAAGITGLEVPGSGAGRLITAQVSGVSGSAQLKVVNGHGELVVRHLSRPGRGKVYEVWVKGAHTKPVPASVLFGVSSNGDADVSLPKSLDGISLVMVTAEPLGGSSVPTHKPVITAQLS
jgi:anti-sigma-K factor RskA